MSERANVHFKYFCLKQMNQTKMRLGRLNFPIDIFLKWKRHSAMAECKGSQQYPHKEKKVE